MPQVTLRQIAEKVGCSRSTVSYALRNSPYISPETRKKVVDVAKDLGWRPDAELNITMSSIRQSSTQKIAPTIAVVINMPKKKLGRNSASSLHLEGVRQRADELGFGVDEFNLAEQPLSPARLKGILEARQFRGVVFIGTIYPSLPETYLEIGKGFTCSVCGIRYPKVPFHVTVPDFLAAGRMAISEMLKEGCKRPGVFITKVVDEPLDWGFSGGAFSGLLDVPVEDRLPIFLIDYMDPGHSFNFDSIEAWMHQYRPDSILTLDIINTRKAFENSTEQWIREVPCYSLDWYPDQAAISGVDLMQRDVGKAAVDLVFDQLSKGQSGIPECQQSVNIEGIWATKESYKESHFYGVTHDA